MNSNKRHVCPGSWKRVARVLYTAFCTTSSIPGGASKPWLTRPASLSHGCPRFLFLIKTTRKIVIILSLNIRFLLVSVEMYGDLWQVLSKLDMCLCRSCRDDTVFWGRRELSAIRCTNDFLKFQTIWCKSICFELFWGGGRTQARTDAQKSNQLRAQSSCEVHENKFK